MSLEVSRLLSHVQKAAFIYELHLSCILACSCLKLRTFSSKALSVLSYHDRISKTRNILSCPDEAYDFMMAPSVPQNPTPAQALALLPKLSDADADLRYMSLNDLYNTLNAGASTFLTNDYHTSAKIIDGVLQTLDDQNGEVQNQAIKW